MIAARDDTMISDEDLSGGPGGRSSNPAKESGDAIPRSGIIESPPGMPDVPACTTAVDLLHHIEHLVDVNTGVENVTAPSIPASDQELSRNVVLRLQQCSAVPFEGIRTELEKGCVRLLGAVASAEASERIEHAIAGMPGIRSVNNRITIQGIQQ